MCECVYSSSLESCTICGSESRTHDWQEQNALNAKWKKDNPDVEFAGWTSI